MAVKDKIMYSFGDLWAVYSINSANNGLVRHHTLFTSKEAAQDAALEFCLKQNQTPEELIFAITRASNNEILRGAGVEEITESLRF